MTEYIPAMPPCQIQLFPGSGDKVPVLLWKVTTSGVKPVIPGPEGVQVYSGKYRATRDYYFLTEDVNS